MKAVLCGTIKAFNGGGTETPIAVKIPCEIVGMIGGKVQVKVDDLTIWVAADQVSTSWAGKGA